MSRATDSGKHPPRKQRAQAAAARGADLAQLRGRNPAALFGEWFAEARRAEPLNPDAAALATVGAGGVPQARNVLIKRQDARGFVFYTSRESRKGKALRVRPAAALAFYWKSLGRQVLVEGETRELPRAAVAAYFQTRPRGSQIGAWASAQSQPIDGYAALAAAAAALEKKYEGKTPPLPPHWSGFILRPARMEFWREGENRLHQRLLFTRSDGGKWRAALLQP